MTSVMYEGKSPISPCRYGYTKGKGKRTMNSHHLHRTVEEDDVDVDVSVNATISAVEAIHCDEICKLRNENIDFVASI